MKASWMLVVLFLCYSYSIKSQETNINYAITTKQNDMKNRTSEEWKKILNDEEYRVLIEKGRH